MKHARPDYNGRPLNELAAPDEPVFVIRAQDTVSGDAVRGWADLAEAAGVSPSMVEMAREHARRMDEWSHKKVADLPPELDGGS